VTTRFGRAQRQVILCLMDGQDRTASRIAMDMMLSDGSAGSALRSLWRRGLVDRAFSYNKIEWHLTRQGADAAAVLFPDGDDPS